MQVASTETVTKSDSTWSEEEFLKLWNDRRQARFRLVLLNGMTVEGYVIKADCTVGEPPTENRLYVCQTLDCKEHPLKDPSCFHLPFSFIRRGCRLDS